MGNLILVHTPNMKPKPQKSRPGARAEKARQLAWRSFEVRRQSEAATALLTSPSSPLKLAA